MNATKSQLACIATICAALRIDKDRKAVMVEGFSAGRCTSSKDLLFAEAAAMIKHLQALSPPPPDKRDKMRRNIIAMAHEMGWEASPPAPLPNGEGRNTPVKRKVDMEKVNQWAARFGKPKLNDYTYEELQKIVFAFKQVLKHYLNSI